MNQRKGFESYILDFRKKCDLTHTQIFDKNNYNILTSNILTSENDNVKHILVKTC